MSEDDDIDIETEDEMQEGDLSGMGGSSLSSTSRGAYISQAERRAHHNALERKRRDHIKDSFTSLRDTVPSLHGDKSSRAQILKKAAEYISYVRRKNGSHSQDIEELRRQNAILEQQIRALEHTKVTGQVINVAAQGTSILKTKGATVSAYDGGSESDSENSNPQSEQSGPQVKRIKLETR